MSNAFKQVTASFNDAYSVNGEIEARVKLVATLANEHATNDCNGVKATFPLRGRVDALLLLVVKDFNKWLEQIELTLTDEDRIMIFDAINGFIQPVAMGWAEAI